MKKVLSLLLILLLLFGCAPAPLPEEVTDLPLLTEAPADPSAKASPDGSPAITTDAPCHETPAPSRAPAATESPVIYGEDYDDRDRVALYLHLFGELPPHFITKAEARKLGWDGGEVEDFRPGAAIGGDWFGNYEGLLPKKKGRSYYECDVGTVGKRSRGAKRIIYSSDGLVYYTDDHYESFTLLYGEE